MVKERGVKRNMERIFCRASLTIIRRKGRNRLLVAFVLLVLKGHPNLHYQPSLSTTCRWICATRALGKITHAHSLSAYPLP